MKDCYTKAQWSKFKMGEIKCEQEKKMEDHLRQCTECMDKYLSLINEDEERCAKLSISLDFNKVAMEKIYKEPVNIKRIMEKRKIRRKNLLIYYTAAASITLIIMSSGMFNHIVDSGTKVTSMAADVHKSIQIKKEFDISKSIVSRTANWIKSFESNNDRR